MDKQQMKDFVNAMGVIAEMSLLFHRNLIQAGATSEEAFRLTQAFIGATMFGSGNDQQPQENTDG